MKNIKRGMFLLFLAFLLPVISMAASYNLGLSPLKSELIMYPGETQEYDLRLMNGTLSDVDYQLEIGSFKLDEDGKYIYLKKEDKYAFSAAKWAEFELNTDHIVVSALDQEKIKVKVTVPRNLKHGGDYYAMLWANFVPKDQNKSKEASGAAISIERRFRFGSILHITVKGRPARSKLEIEKISMINFDEMATSTKRGIELNVFVKNTGDLSYRPTGDFMITSSDRKVWGRGKLEMSQTDLVMPSTVRKMYAIYDRTLPSGEYIAKISVKSGKRYIGQKEYKFSIKVSTSTAKLLGVNFKVQPPQIIIDAKAGYTQMNKIEVYNREFTTINVKLSSVPISMKEDGSFVYGTTTLKDVKIYPPKFSLREDQKRVIPFSLRIPKEKKGELVFAVKVDSSLKDSSENESTLYVPVLMRLIGSTHYDFKVKKVEKIFTFPATTTQKATTVVRIWIKNTGNTFTNFNLTYDLVDPEGNYLTSQAKQISNRGFLILPNSERYVDIPLSDYKFKNAGMYSIPFILAYKGDKNKEERVKMKVNFEITEKEIQKMVEGTI
jgi:VCBS repeat-containing protein